MEDEKIHKLSTEVEVLKEKLQGYKDKVNQYQQLVDSNLKTAQDSMNKRLETMNEFRTQLDKQAATFVTKESLDSQKSAIELILKQLIDKIEKQIEGMETRVSKLENSWSNLQGRISILGLILTVLLIFLSWYLNTRV